MRKERRRETHVCKGRYHDDDQPARGRVRWQASFWVDGEKLSGSDEPNVRTLSFPQLTSVLHNSTSAESCRRAAVFTHTEVAPAPRIPGDTGGVLGSKSTSLFCVFICVYAVVFTSFGCLPTHARVRTRITTTT